MKTLTTLSKKCWMGLLSMLRPARKKGFLECLKDYFNQVAIDRQLSDSTIEKYGYCYQNIERFLNSKNLRDISVNNVTIPLMEELRAWLHNSRKSCGKTHSSRHLEKCIAGMDYAVRRGWLKYNPISALETGRDKRKPVVHLTSGELTRFIFYNFQNITFQKVQILYVYGCCTGLSYGNLFDYETRIDENDGGLWIEDRRKKVGQKPFYVPISEPGFEIALAIHKAFNGKLPKMENASFNRYLKEMAAILGINKKLTTHTARKTFATLMDQDGFALGVIAAILGNSEEVCRNDYIAPSKKKIEKAMRERKETTLLRSVLNN